MVLPGWQCCPIPLNIKRKDKIPNGFAQAPNRTRTCEHGYYCQQCADNANRMYRCFHKPPLLRMNRLYLSTQEFSRTAPPVRYWPGFVCCALTLNVQSREGLAHGSVKNWPQHVRDWLSNGHLPASIALQ